MAKIKEQLSAAKRTIKKTSNTSSKAKELIWKPEEGDNTIRIVPRPDELDNPFVKLLFHYQFTNQEGKSQTFISPSNFGKADPVIELSERLKASGDRKLWGKGKSLEPKARNYVPIIVRGKEVEGVKWWGFGVQIFDQLVAAIDELELAGETITDLTNGYDIKVEFIPAEKSTKVSPDGKKFPETKIAVKRKSSPVVSTDNPAVKEILEKITKKQPVLSEAWECPAYDVLAKALEIFLKKNEAGHAAATAVPTIEVKAEDDNVILPTEEQIAAATSPSAAKAVSNVAAPTSTADEMTAVFDELFNEKSK